MEGLATNSRHFAFTNTIPSINFRRLVFLWNSRNISYILFLAFALGLIGFIFLQNLAPLGATVKYQLHEQNDEKISIHKQNNRIKEISKDGETVYQQTGDLIYFSTAMPFHFDRATVKLTYQDSTPIQSLLLGYKDQANWHYATKPLTTPFKELSTWQQIGTDPILYQRENTYASIDEFLKQPPSGSIVGLYNYSDVSSLYTASLPSYTPQDDQTIIETPLRGRHTLYTYVANEPFEMDIQKQDMNWYQGDDTMTVKIYKADVLVFEARADDDGVTDASRAVKAPQTVTIKNPGPELPESGVYKIVIEANGDTIIKRIATNLQKIVFEGQIFLAGNAAVYPKVIQRTVPTNLFTNALLLNFSTYHKEGLQRITSGAKTLRLTDVNKDGQIIPPDPISKITIPENDVIVHSHGGFIALSESQFFEPTPYRLLTLNDPDQLALVDYVLSSAKTPEIDNEWKVSEQTFDLSDAVIQDGRLSWLIQAPQLQKNNNTILIKDIEVTMQKNPIL